VADHDVIMNRNAQELPCGDELLGDSSIFRRWCRLSTRVIVNENDSARTSNDCRSEHLARMDKR